MATLPRLLNTVVLTNLSLLDAGLTRAMAMGPRAPFWDQRMCMAMLQQALSNSQASSVWLCWQGRPM